MPGEICGAGNDRRALDRRKNPQAQNFDFDRKKTEYFLRKGTTPFPLTSQVLAEACPQRAASAKPHRLSGRKTSRNGKLLNGTSGQAAKRACLAAIMFSRSRTVTRRGFADEVRSVQRFLVKRSRASSMTAFAAERIGCVER